MAQKPALPDPRWTARVLFELAQLHTPEPAQLEMNLEPEAGAEPSLKKRAAELRQEAIAEGRATPRPAPGTGDTQAETPDELARAAEVGARRAHARLARLGRNTDDSDESK